MTCSTCGYDAPVVPTQDPEVVCCVRCRATYAWHESQRRAYRLDGVEPRDSREQQPSRSIREAPFPAAALGAPPPIVASDEDWDDIYLPSPTPSPKRATRAAATVMVPQPQPPAVSSGHRARRFAWLQWSVLTLGVLMFTCGAVLIAWSFNQGQQSLWNLGAPLALAGQLSFLVGLVLQLDVLWQQSAWQGESLRRLDQQVSISGLGPTPLPADHDVAADKSSLAKAATAADPQQLLSDLRRQLDRVANRLPNKA